MASPGNQHCANGIGTLSFPISLTRSLYGLEGSNAVVLGTLYSTAVTQRDVRASRIYVLPFIRQNATALLTNCGNAHCNFCSLRGCSRATSLLTFNKSVQNM